MPFLRNGGRNPYPVGRSLEPAWLLGGNHDLATLDLCLSACHYRPAKLTVNGTAGLLERRS